ncbi:MAG: NifU family protein, partial [Kiritimatiellae bacterium]|nr:NifU family protein [Kiritimatiellia bacterium]
PALALDGGDVELVDVQGSRVAIRFLGHCARCMAAHLTQDGLVQKKLREELGDDSIVVETLP